MQPEQKQINNGYGAELIGMRILNAAKMIISHEKGSY